MRRQRARRIGVHAEHDSYKWWALSCTSLGMLLATINSGTLIIALPDLERSLHTSLLELVWVILVYMIASTVLVLSAGRLSDQFGRKQAYIGGFVLFAVASLGAGFAGSGTELILWRILQGIGGSFLFANAAAIVTDAFPREQLGLAMGTNTMVAADRAGDRTGAGRRAGARSRGPGCSGSTCRSPSAGARGRGSILHEVTGRSEDTSFDALGTITFLIGLTGLVYGISKGGISGWDNTSVIASLIAAAVLLPGFVLIESRVKSPMLDLSIFKNRLFSAASLAAFTERAGPVRADVRVRLLLPGRPGRLADPRRDQAGAAGARDADRLAAGRDLGRPPRLARDGRGRDARAGRRAGADDHARARHHVRRAAASTCSSSASARGCSTRPTPPR